VDLRVFLKFGVNECVCVCVCVCARVLRRKWDEMVYSEL